MKVSYLILAHDNLIHLERLIDELSDDNTRIYVHLDKRIDCPVHLQEKPNVFFISNPLRVYWGGFSTVQATLKLIRYALDHGFGDYYALISGTDFPVKKKEDFYKHLAQGGEFISILSPKKARRFQRYLFYHFEKFERRKFWHPRNACFHLIETLLKIFLPKRKPPFKIYFGSTWFILTQECLHFVLKELEKDTRYVDFFKHTVNSDEAFIHTIIGNSPFLAQTRTNLTYTYWPSKLAPGPIAEKQIDILKNNSTFTGKYGTFTPFFARKFNDQSSNVVELIKKELF